MKFIGITGGVGAGKSELLKYIKKHYLCEIYLADEVAHEVKKKGSPCYEELVALLGKDVLQEDGEIDKLLMAKKIFADEVLLSKVNDLIHPAVRTYLLDRLALAKEKQELELFFVEAALLIECGYGALVDEMWYIHADTQIRKKRLMETRGYTEQKVEQIFSSQLSEEVFRKGSQFVIDNSGNIEESYKQINEKLEAFTWQE